jgi:hypothetical protein
METERQIFQKKVYKKTLPNVDFSSGHGEILPQKLVSLLRIDKKPQWPFITWRKAKMFFPLLKFCITHCEYSIVNHLIVCVNKLAFSMFNIPYYIKGMTAWQMARIPYRWQDHCKRLRMPRKWPDA